jgi:hypothetical protein
MILAFVLWGLEWWRRWRRFWMGWSMSDALLENTDIMKCLCCGQKVERPGRRLDAAKCEHGLRF